MVLVISTILDQSGGVFFCPASCVFLLHMGLETTTLQIWPKVGKPVETAGDQWVKKFF